MATKHSLSGSQLRALITIASSGGFMLFAYDNGVFAGLLVLPWFLKTFNNPNPKLLGTINATYNLGGFVGGILAFFLGSKLGRRRTILSGMLICAIGAIIQCSAIKLGALVTGRLICGIGVGTLTSTVGLWQAEVSPQQRRGMFLVLQVFGGGCLGLVLAQWINYGFHNNTGRVAFVFPLAFQLLFVVMSASLVIILPESPRWLMKQGRKQECRAILARLDLGDGETVDARMAEIEGALQMDMSGAGGGQYKELISNGPTRNLHRLCLAIGTMVFHQLNGINTVTYYMPTLLIKFAGVSHETALWVTGLTSIITLVTTSIPAFTIDRIGRRALLWGGAAAQAVEFIILAVLLATKPSAADANAHAFGIGTVAMIFLVFCTNSATWYCVSWAYPAEILPLQIREMGLALGNICYWLFQFMMVEITPIALQNISYKFYVILAIFNVAIALIIYFLWTETKGLSLEEIDFKFAGRDREAVVMVGKEGAGMSEEGKFENHELSQLESRHPV